VYLEDILEDILEEGFAHKPADPIINTFLPWWLEDATQLAQHAPLAYRAITNATLDAGVRERLQEVFVSWMLERFKHKRYEEVMAMLNILTPLEETVAYKQLVGIGWKKGKVEGQVEGRVEGKVEGKREEAQRILQRLLARRFGPLSEAQQAQLAEATLEQLESWSDQILDAESLDALLGSESA
jgi:predicted transposase YdaD